MNTMNFSGGYFLFSSNNYTYKTRSFVKFKNYLYWVMQVFRLFVFYQKETSII